nr:13969_t:CDS:2 [Entrophospora candida]CAG8500669.1 4742_t:CDS:2 [Entrophospora candida]
MAKTSILSVFRVLLTVWLVYQTVKAITFLHLLSRKHSYYDPKVAFVIGVQTVAPPIIVINVVTWIVFWFDKQQSKLRNWRTPERELLWWLWTTGVFGGWLSMFEQHANANATTQLDIAQEGFIVNSQTARKRNLLEDQ